MCSLNSTGEATENKRRCATEMATRHYGMPNTCVGLSKGDPKTRIADCFEWMNTNQKAVQSILDQCSPGKCNKDVFMSLNLLHLTTTPNNTISYISKLQREDSFSFYY